MDYKCTNNNLKIKSIKTDKFYRMPTDKTCKFVKFARGKAIIELDKCRYTLDTSMFNDWFVKL